MPFTSVITTEAYRLKLKLSPLANKKMKLKKKLLIALIISLLLLVTSVAGTFFYYYTHPDSVEHLITRVISSSTGMACTVETLSYSLDPLTVRADGITLAPSKDQTGLHLRISDLAADMSLEGRFGRKTLIIEHIRIHKFLLNVPEQFVMPEYKREQESSSFLSQILGWTATWFMFRDISFKEVTVLDGQITALFGEGRMQIKGIRANMNPNHLIGISGNLVLEWPSQGVLFTAPEIRVTTQDAISLKAPRIAGFLAATDATFQSPEIDVKGMETKGTIEYSTGSFWYRHGPVYPYECNRDTHRIPFPGILAPRTRGVLQTQR